MLFGKLSETRAETSRLAWRLVERRRRLGIQDYTVTIFRRFSRVPQGLLRVVPVGDRHRADEFWVKPVGSSRAWPRRRAFSTQKKEDRRSAKLRSLLPSLKPSPYERPLSGAVPNFLVASFLESVASA